MFAEMAVGAGVPGTTEKQAAECQTPAWGHASYSTRFPSLSVHWALSICLKASANPSQENY